MEFHSSMIELHRKVNPKEVIVGWYATGNDITQHSVLIHEFYGRETEIPVHLTVNTDLKKENMAINCYTSSPLGTPGNPTGTVFTPINSEIVYVEAERVGGMCSWCNMVAFNPIACRSQVAFCRCVAMRSLKSLNVLAIMRLKVPPFLFLCLLLLQWICLREAKIHRPASCHSSLKWIISKVQWQTWWTCSIQFLIT